MRKPIHITKARSEQMRAAFVKDAMREIAGLTLSDANKAFDLLHKHRAVFEEGRQPVSIKSLAADALAKVAELKRVLA